jgi:Arc/MetJ family transcription regulator
VRTTLEIDEALIAEAVKLTGEKNKGRAVNKALAEFVRRRKVEELRQFIREVELVDNWEQFEELELEETRREP